MRETRGMGRNVIFQGMSSNIPGNVAKYSGECRKTFRGMSPNISGNVLRYSGGCHQAFQGMSLCGIAFIGQFCGNKENTFSSSGNRTRTFAVRPRCHNHYALVNQWIVLTDYLDFQLALHKTLFHAIATHSLANNTLPTLQKTKLDILPLNPLLFYKGFTISKWISFPSWETVADQ